MGRGAFHDQLREVCKIIGNSYSHRYQGGAVRTAELIYVGRFVQQIRHLQRGSLGKWQSQSANISRCDEGHKLERRLLPRSRNNTALAHSGAVCVEDYTITVQ